MPKRMNQICKEKETVSSIGTSLKIVCFSVIENYQPNNHLFRNLKKPRPIRNSFIEIWSLSAKPQTIMPQNDGRKDPRKS